jgi:adenylate cyclase
VNLGSRLEGITKEYGVRIICSGSTKDSLKNPERFVLRELDWIKVKGKNEPVTIYEVMRFPAAEREKFLRVREFFESGLGKYRQRKFAEAQSDFMLALQLVPQDGPSSTFLERCEYFKENPVHEDWEGIWIMKSK